MLLQAVRMARLALCWGVLQQILQQRFPLGAMTVALEFDVPIDVVDEMA